ncbi:Sec-independent protein translocase protein TatB [Salinispirillum marinum]|uniref:Sec-independent protein translocase protein TatB n=2 Tax=Saccharospirillaceae TaxID=255527 RepID=A0ABV8BHS4_9GAMM
MFDVGFLELAVIAGIALIVLGPERLPSAARTVGRYVGQAKRMVGNFQRQIEQEVRLEELNKKIMDDTKGQTFINNDGTTSGGATAVKREPADNDPTVNEIVPPQPASSAPNADAQTTQEPNRENAQ